MLKVVSVEKRTKFKITSSSVTEQCFHKLSILGLCIDPLVIKPECLPIPFPLEVLVALLLEVLRNFCIMLSGRRR